MIGWVIFLILCAVVFGPVLILFLGASAEAFDSPNSWTFKPKIIVNPIEPVKYPPVPDYAWPMPPADWRDDTLVYPSEEITQEIQMPDSRSI